jgi:DNA polymerase-3 subunit epsilon
MTGDPYAPWWSHTLVVFDVETTGLDETDRVVELGLARFENGELVDEWGTLVYPDMEIPQEASEIHGITTVDVSTAPPFVGALPGVMRITRGAYPVAYNASFDRRMWVRELHRTALADIKIPIFDPTIRWLDPLTWVRKIDGVWGKNKLTVACERYGVSLQNAHRATDDAVAAGRLLYTLKERLPSCTMTEMIRRQERLHQLQDEERAKWFKKKGIPYERR